EQIAKLERLEHEIEQAVERLRSMMFELHPPVLERQGLVAALEQYGVQWFSEDGVEFDLESQMPEEPPAEIRNLASRISQEALVNVRKHARAKRVKVFLNRDAEGIEVTIADDGSGFSADPPGSVTPGHLGLLAKRERAEMAGGSWSLETRP